MPRWLLTFSRGEALQYVGHLDLARAWQRAFGRAGIALARTRGFHPHPKLAFAAPLPVGILGAAELLDVELEDELDAAALRSRLAPQLPSGLALIAAAPLEGRPLPARLCWAEYRAWLPPYIIEHDIAARLAGLLSAAALPRSRQREREIRHYDLRPLIADLSLERDGERLAIAMRLLAGTAGTGRPDEVVAALGLGEACCRIERTRLILAD